MSVVKRIFSSFLIILMLLLMQSIISGKVQDNCGNNNISQDFRSIDCTYQHLYVHSSAKSAAKKNVPVRNYLSVIFITIIPLIAHLKFDFANIFFAITHIPVYHWQLARGDLSADAVLSY